MNRKDLRDYCLSKPAAIEDFPFGEDVAVMKVLGKMFALLPVGSSAQISLKCDPDWAVILRQTYPAVKAGYHLNKQHWNSIEVNGTIPDDEIREMIDHSYSQVVKSLKKPDREKLSS